MTTLRQWICWVVAALLATMFVPGCGLGGPPSDLAMIAHFQDRRAAFEAIAAMMAEERMVGALETDPSPGESNAARARRERYRSLVRLTGCDDIVRDADGRIAFNRPYPTSGGGVAGTGFTGYVRTTTTPSPIVPRLDEGGLRRFEDTYRHVSGPWYLWRVRI